jgi:hypothetical protein
MGILQEHEVAVDLGLEQVGPVALVGLVDQLVADLALGRQDLDRLDDEDLGGVAGVILPLEPLADLVLGLGHVVPP